MISIHKSLLDLETLAGLQKTTAGCYRDAIECLARYAVEVDPALIAAHRTHLEEMARRLDNHENVAAIVSISPDLRGELRDYRERVSEFVDKLRTELADNSRTLQDMIDALSAVPEDGDEPARVELRKLRTLARTVPRPDVAAAIAACADGLESCLEGIHQQHRATVGQFLVEVRILHQRIGALQKALASDVDTKLLSRHEFGARAAELLGTGEHFTAIMFHVVNLFQIERMYGEDIAAQVVAAFAKRLDNQLQQGALAARWTRSEFVLMAVLDRGAAIQLCKEMSPKLGGAYACMENGRTRSVTVRVSYGVVDGADLDAPGLASRLDALALGSA